VAVATGAAVVVATEVVVAVAAAEVVAAEVHAAEVPLRIRGTKFISKLRARSGLPGGLFSFRMGYFEMHPPSRFST